MNQKVKPLLGWFTSTFYLLHPQTRERVRKIVEDILQDAKTAPREKTFVMMMGYSLSGKTWVVQNHPVLSQFFQVATRDIHDLLNTRFPLLDDDKSVEGPGYWPRQFLTRTIRKWVLEGACRQGVAIVNDSGNQVASERRARLRIPKRSGYKTVIVWVISDEETLMGRLKSADSALKEQGKTPTWVNLYQNVQQKRFEAPSREEADDLIIFQSGWDDWDAISL